MLNLSYFTLAAWAIALLLTLVLAAWLTPARWWRQLNARALAVVGLGTWALASLILALAPAPPAPPTTLGVAPLPLQLPLQLQLPAPNAGRRYRVHQDLNLRAAKGTEARRIAIVRAGTEVTTTGAGDGDWWQVRTRIGGKEVSGWSSSLWLRRADETAR